MYDQKCSKISKYDCKILHDDDDDLHLPFKENYPAGFSFEKRQSGQLLKSCDKKEGLLNTFCKDIDTDTNGCIDLDLAKLSRSNSSSKSMTNQQQSSSTNFKSISKVNDHFTNGVTIKSSRKTPVEKSIKMPKWFITLALIYIVLIIPFTITPVMGKPTSTSTTVKPLVKSHHHHHHQQQKQQNKERDKLVEKSRNSNIEYEMEMERLKKVEESIQQSLESVASLSIVRSLDILRHNWLLEVNKNKKRTAQNKKAAENKAILDQIG